MMIASTVAGRKKRTPQNSPPAIRCAIYTRKSSEEGLELEFNSLDAQREAAEAFIASQKNEGWSCNPERYDDGGFSGGNAERPGLKHLLADIEAGQIDCVIVYKVDRLSRSLMDFARMMEVFERHNVSFVSVTQQFNTTHSMGRLTLNILLSFAQFEREIIGERIRDKIAAQRRKGKWAGGTPVLGYDVDRSGNSPKLVIIAEEAARVRQIYEMYLSLGSLLPVLDEVRERGWCNKEWITKKGKPKGGSPFDKGSLHALLTNPLYVGKIKHKTDVFDGEHEPIVEPAVFGDVQTRLHRNGRDGGTRVRNKHGALLKGLLTCTACDRTMIHTFTNKGNRRYRYYTCGNAIKNGRKNCPTRSLPADEIEHAVVDEIRNIGDDAGLRKEVLLQTNEAVAVKRNALETERRDLERQLKRDHGEIGRLAASGNESSATVNALAELNERVRRGESRLPLLREQMGELNDQNVTRADLDAAFADFDNVWNELSPREQCELLNLLVARIEFDAGDSSISVSFHPTNITTLATRGRKS